MNTNYFKMEEAILAKKTFGIVSASYFQRKFKMNYAAAKKLADQINAENEYLCKKSE